MKTAEEILTNSTLLTEFQKKWIKQNYGDLREKEAINKVFKRIKDSAFYTYLDSDDRMELENIEIELKV
jgi:hypothetical protein